MISICIPIFNYDVRELVSDLHQQAVAAGAEFEILLADDGSRGDYKDINRECVKLAGVELLELTRNVGRSRIRNLLASKARYPKIIFLDCDSQCPDKDFIRRYIESATENSIVCGGRSYNFTPPDDDTYLHWLFGLNREVRSASERELHPYNSFMTNNFMIPTEIFLKISFDESLLGYGHEDTLFGLELLKKNIPVKHINNPLIHAGLQSAEDFLYKTRQGTRNLLKIYWVAKRDDKLPEIVKLLKVWTLLRRWGLCRPTAYVYRYLEPFIIRNLNSKRPSLLLLDFYKLGNICRQTIRFRKN